MNNQLGSLKVTLENIAFKTEFNKALKELSAVDCHIDGKYFKIGKNATYIIPDRNLSNLEKMIIKNIDEYLKSINTKM
jgi:hypothetical protein